MSAVLYLSLLALAAICLGWGWIVDRAAQLRDRSDGEEWSPVESTNARMKRVLKK